MSKKFDYNEKESKEKDQIIKNLQNGKINVEKQIKELEHEVDRQEQYSRRTCILFHGIQMKTTIK